MLPLLAAASLAPVLLAIPDLPSFPRADTAKTHTFAPVDPGTEWTDAIVSWNISDAEGAFLKIEARVLKPESTTPWYTLAIWSQDAQRGQRTSVNGQKDDEARVMTDTLRIANPGGKLQLRAYMERFAGSREPTSWRRIRFGRRSFFRRADTGRCGSTCSVTRKGK